MNTYAQVIASLGEPGSGGPARVHLDLAIQVLRDAPTLGRRGEYPQWDRRGDAHRLSPAQLRERLTEDPTLGLSFGRWRGAATEHEAQNGRRLLTLATSLRTIEGCGPSVEARRFRALIREAWGVDVPGPGADLRTWSARVTRDTSELPGWMRDL